MNFTVAFLIAMLHIFTFEGGYVASLGDGAGATKYGITHVSYPRENIRQLTKRRAGELYHKDFWAPLRADEMTCITSITIFDFSINAGKNTAIKTTQHVLGLPESGVVTDAMIKALAMREQHWAFNDYNQHRAQYYRECRQFGKYGKGWLKRIPRESECQNTSITEAQVF